MTTWRELLTEAMSIHHETYPDDVLATTLTEEELNKEFDNPSWVPPAGAFTLWTKDRVYFPDLCPDETDCLIKVTVQSVPRTPCDEKTDYAFRW